MVRLLLFLLGMVTTSRPAAAAYGPAGSGPAPGAAYGPAGSGPPAAGPGRFAPVTAEPPSPTGLWPEQPPPAAPRAPGPGGPRRRVPRKVTWAVILIVAGLIFRRAVAWLVVAGVSGALHLAGVNVHLPRIRFGWPWQTVSAPATTTALGPWVLQKIEGISRPAFGQANFSFHFTHKVSKNIGPLPCWYASTFYAAGHASATVNLNPGRAWWARGSGHYRLQVLSRPSAGRPGQVAVTMALPQPQLPQTVHDVTIDNIPSKPIATQHSWTYPGLGCGVLIRPQFPQSVLYAQAQEIAFDRVRNVPQVTRPLLATAQAQAALTIRDNFVQPTLNALGYRLDHFTVSWVAPRSPARPAGSG